MREDKIKAIPKYILKRIEKEDAKRHPAKTGDVRFYAYLTKNGGELVKVTVAVKHKYKKFYCKQVAVHGLDSDRCFFKDIVFYYIGGYSVGWYAEGLQKAPKWYESPEWDWNIDKLFDPFAPVVNKEYIAKFPEYKYSAFELYSGHDVLKYLRQYEKYPHMEYMMKIGLESYIYSKMIMEKAKKDKRFRKWLAKNRELLGKRIYYISTILLAYKTDSDIAEAQAYEEAKKTLCRERDYAPIRELFCGRYEEIINYVAKQKNFRITAYHPKEDISVILDSNGRFEKLWEFSAHLLQKGFKIIEASKEESCEEGNLPKYENSRKILLRAIKRGKAESEPIPTMGNQAGICIDNLYYILR